MITCASGCRAAAPVRKSIPIAIMMREARDQKLAQVRDLRHRHRSQSRGSARAARYRKLPPGLSSERFDRWFVKDGDDYCPVKEIRDLCVFSVHSVIKDPPFSKLDLISCRNVLIYLNGDLQHRVMQTFHYALKPEGYPISRAVGERHA